MYVVCPFVYKSVCVYVGHFDQIHGLGWVDLYCVDSLSAQISLGANGNLAEVAVQLDRMVGQSYQSQPNQRI